MPASLAAVWARTTPASVLRSATPMAASFSSAAWPTISCGVRGAAQEGEIGGGDEFGKAGSRKHPMHEPLRRRRRAVQAIAEKPEAAAAGILDDIVIALDGACAAPPFGRDALRPLCLCDLVRDAAPAEAAAAAHRGSTPSPRPPPAAAEAETGAARREHCNATSRAVLGGRSLQPRIHGLLGPLRDMTLVGMELVTRRAQDAAAGDRSAGPAHPGGGILTHGRAPA